MVAELFADCSPAAPAGSCAQADGLFKLHGLRELSCLPSCGLYHSLAVTARINLKAHAQVCIVPQRYGMQTQTRRTHMRARCRTGEQHPHSVYKPAQTWGLECRAPQLGQTAIPDWPIAYSADNAT